MSLVLFSCHAIDTNTPLTGPYTHPVDINKSKIKVYIEIIWTYSECAMNYALLENSFDKLFGSSEVEPEPSRDSSPGCSHKKVGGKAAGQI